MKKFALLLVFGCATAFAQSDYPNKPVRLVVGFAAGGISDVFGRAIAIPLSKQLGQQVIDELPAAPDFDLARRIVHKMHVDGELDEVALLQFVKRERYAESVMALSQMCATPHDILHRLFQSDRNEAWIVPCRAAGLSWTTVRAFLVSVSDRHLPPNELEELKSDYARLSQTTAQRVLRFWCVQKAAGKETFFD